MATPQITAIINLHNEGLIAVPSLRSIAHAKEHAEQHDILVEVIAVLDCPDLVTRELIHESEVCDSKLEITEGDLGAARNNGIQAASGEFVAFLDGDDLWTEEWLTLAYSAAQGDERSVIWHPELVLYFDASGGAKLYRHADMEEKAFDVISLALKNSWTALCFARREVFVSVPYRRNDLLKQSGYEDWSWNMETIARGTVHKVVPTTGHAVRIRPGSLRHQTLLSQALPYASNLIRDYIASNPKPPGEFEHSPHQNIPSGAGFSSFSEKIELKINLGDQPRSEPLGAGPASNTSTDEHKINFGELRRSEPFSINWGFDRGRPVDRYFIEEFLQRHSGDVRGRVLEIKDNVYTRQFGSNDTLSEILDITCDNPKATIIADITDAQHVESNAFDCIILTQTLQLIFDIKSAIATIYRLLKPGGVLLVTVPAITPDFLTPVEGEFYWAIFPAALRSILSEQFDPRKLLIDARGNMATAIAFLAGLAQQDLAEGEFVPNDPHFPMIVTARAVKSKASYDIGLAVTPLKPTTVRPVVSVVTAFFNAERFLRDAIESVLAQSCDDWELVLVNDGSTDRSFSIAEEYRNRYPFRISLIQHPTQRNEGPSATRNLGFANARGEFIAWLDADDLWMPEKLSHDIRVLRANPEAAAVFSPALWWWEDGSQPPRLDRLSPPLDALHLPPIFFRSTFLRREAEAPCPCAVTFRREVLNSLEPMDSSLPPWEDQKFFAELSFKFPVYISGKCVSEYRRTSGSLWSTAQLDGRDAAAGRKFIDWLTIFLKHQHAVDPILLEELTTLKLTMERC